MDLYPAPIFRMTSLRREFSRLKKGKKMKYFLLFLIVCYFGPNLDAWQFPALPKNYFGSRLGQQALLGSKRLLAISFTICSLSNGVAFPAHAATDAASATFTDKDNLVRFNHPLSMKESPKLVKTHDKVLTHSLTYSLTYSLNYSLTQGILFFI